MSGTQFIILATTLAIALILAGMFLTLVRIVRGPTLPDRIMALDLLTTLALGLIGVMALRTGVMAYVDIALAICLLGFLATVALARFVLERQARDGQGRLRGAEPDQRRIETGFGPDVKEGQP